MTTKKEIRNWLKKECHIGHLEGKNKYTYLTNIIHGFLTRNKPKGLIKQFHGIISDIRR